MAIEDELKFESAPDIQTMNYVHENTVLPYFARSPFFDAVANNQTLETQAITNPSRAHIMQLRETMESTLSQMQGLEYRVAASPREYTGEAPPGQGRWVIRKQNRRKIAGRDDDVSVLAAYYVIGGAIYKAPSVASLLRNRLMTASFNLSKLTTAAASLSQFTPARGHTYFDPKSKPDTRAKSGRQRIRETPLLGQSQEGSPRVDSQEDTDQNKTAQQIASSDTQTFLESFDQFQRYRNELMDENPLVGEPGSFSFTTSKQYLQAQQHTEREMARKQRVADSTSRAATPPRSMSPNSNQKPMGQSTGKSEPERDKVAAASVKSKRRKSKAAGSPSSPVVASFDVSEASQNP